MRDQSRWAAGALPTHGSARAPRPSPPGSRGARSRRPARASEARVVEGAALEARPLGPDAAEVGSVEPAGPEDAAWPGREEGLETQVQGQAAEVAGDEGAAGEVEPVEAGPAEVDLREDSPTEGNDRLVRRTSFFGQIAFLRPLSCHFVEGA